MTVRMELQHLLGLAIGTPEAGGVNFNILHGVVREILKHLAIDNKPIELEEGGHFGAAYGIVKTSVDGVTSDTSNKTASDSASQEAKDGQQVSVITTGFEKSTLPGHFGKFESKLSEIEKKLEMLDDLPSNSEVLQRAKQRKDTRTPVGDMWQFININRRLGATETGIEKLSSLLDSMMSEVNDIKEMAGGIDEIKKRLAELEKKSSALEQRISSLESVDNSEDKKKLEDLLKELKKLQSQVNELPTKDDIGDLDIFVKWPQLEEALNARSRPRTATPKPPTPAPTPPPPPRTPTPVHPSEDALEALRQVGELRDKHEDMVEKVGVLEEKMPTKANLEDLEELKKRPAVPPDIVDQLKKMREAIDAINKWREEKTIPTDLEDQLKSLREGLALLDSHKNQINQMSNQLKGLRNVTDLLKDHNEKVQLIPDDLLEQLNKLKYLEKKVNQMSDSSHQLPHKLQRMEDRFKEDFEREIRTLRDGLRLLNYQFEKLKKMKGEPTPAATAKGQGDGTIDSLRNMLLDLQAEQEKLDSLTKELVEEHNRKQKHIDALYEYVERLQEHKADKEQVAMEIDVKADKRALDNLISRLKFDQSIGNLDQAIQDLLNRLEANEVALTDALKRLSDDVDEKLDRKEIDPLRDYFEKKIKSMKCKHADLPLNEDPAAGFRKALLRFHCISCDRPVDMAQGPPNPALPQSPSLPASRTARAYTTFELDQIRQMNRGIYPNEQDVITTSRACGGSHTMTYPHRRTARFNQYYYYRDEEIIPVPLAQRDETELVGEDGQIYKGRIDEQQYREVSSPRQTPRPQRVASAKRSPSPQPPQTGSPTNRRPRSAVPSSPRSRAEGTEPHIPEVSAS